MPMLRTMIVLILAGCASHSPTDYEQQNDLVLAREEFQKRQQACRNAGGSMRVPAKATKLQQPRYSAQDYRLAYCQ